MIITDSESRITGLQLGEISIKCLKEPNVMEAKYALVSVSDSITQKLVRQLPHQGPVNVATHGACTAYHNNWSAETLKKLDDLIVSMERDLVTIHFMEDRHVQKQRLEVGGDEEASQV